MLFSIQTAFNMAKSILLGRRNPIYVQFYVTSRCNLTCKQCNIIYANANVREATLDEIRMIAKNLRRIGLGIILLTGGEPFVRQDLPEIIHAFESEGIHVRTQTNGLATRDQLTRAVKAGARDISISLDSLCSEKQDFLNGSYASSWHRAMETIALVTQTYPVRDSFAAFGTVLSPHNLLEIPNIIRFASRIGWYVSLVPAHITSPSEVYNFRSYDREMKFPRAMWPHVDRVLDECLELKRQGYALYDSAEYINNIRKFIREEPLTWRRKNNDMCDSPHLYFAIRPNGDLSVCCDHNIPVSFPVWHADFPAWYQDGRIAETCHPFVQACQGCMYGSYPEMSITAHYPSALISRIPTFLQTPLRKPWPITVEQLVQIAEEINTNFQVDHHLGQQILEAAQRHADVTKTDSSLPFAR